MMHKRQRSDGCLRGRFLRSNRATQGSQRPYFDCQLSYHCNDVCALHDVVGMVSCHLRSSAFTSYKSKAVTNCTQFFYSRKLGKNTTILCG